MESTEELLKKTFDPYFEAPLEVWKSFIEKGEVISAAKNEIIKSYNQTENYLYFILQGSGGIMLYHNNNYVCVDLCFENDFFGDYFSFITKQPTPLEVICFESSTLFRISRGSFRELSQTEYGRIICQTASESLFIHKQQQQIELLSKTAEQRYREMLEKQPGIVQRTPNKYTASYLGITPESFSRIRKNIC
jgi:CRP-like cAMP-binding protein